MGDVTDQRNPEDSTSAIHHRWWGLVIKILIALSVVAIGAWVWTELLEPREAEFETELQLATRLQLHAEYETTERYHVGLEYRLDEHLSLEGAYTSDVDVSLGVKLRF